MRLFTVPEQGLRAGFLPVAAESNANDPQQQ